VSGTWATARVPWPSPMRLVDSSICCWKSMPERAGRPSAARRRRRGPAAEVESQRTGRAMRYGAAMRFGNGHQQRVQLVEERGIRRQVGLEKPARLLVPTTAGHEPVTREHTARVRVGHEDGPAGRIEKDGIGRLRAEAGAGDGLA